jgi:hypothetical protein
MEEKIVKIKENPALIKLFLKKVELLKTNVEIKTHQQCIYGMQHLATKISEKCIGDDEKLKFSLALFVAHLEYIEALHNSESDLPNMKSNIAKNWNEQMEALSKN